MSRAPASRAGWLHTRDAVHIGLLVLVLAVGTFANVRFALGTGDALACYNLGIDTDKYDTAARRVAATGEVDVPPLQPPGYILYLGVLYRLFGARVLVPKLLACAMVLGIAAGVWWIGRRYLSPAAGLVGAALTVTSPVFRAYAATLQYEVLAALLFLASLLLVLLGIRASTSPRRAALLVAGALCCVVATLTRETFLALFPVLLVYVGTRIPARPALRAAAVGAMLAIYASGVGAWTLWQRHRTGQWILVSQKGPLVMAFGNNPNANGTFNATLRPVLEPYGWEFLRERPFAAARLAVRKLGYFFGFLKDGWNVPRPLTLVVSRLAFGSLRLGVCESLARGATSALGLVGCVMVLANRRLRRETWIVPALVLTAAAGHMVSISSHRFAIPVLALALLMAGHALATAARWWWLRSRGVRYASGAALALWCGAALAIPTGVHDTINATDLDGTLADDVRDVAASGGRARFADAARGAREMAVLTNTMLPRGAFRLELSVRADGAGVVGEVLVPIEGSAETFKRPIRASGGAGYDRLTVYGTLERASAVKVVVVTNASAGVWLGRMTLAAGDDSRVAPPGSERSAVVDFGAKGPWEDWLISGWSGRERWGDELDFQWSVGARSVLLLPSGDASDLVLDIRAMPFAPRGTPVQTLRVRVNGSDVGAVLLGRGWRWYRVVAGRSTLRRGMNTVELLHGRAIRPVDVPGEGADTRPLAAAYDLLRASRLPRP